LTIVDVICYCGGSVCYHWVRFLICDMITIIIVTGQSSINVYVLPILASI
jgi:hypothetical protein